MQVTIDLSVLDNLTAEAGKIFIDPKSEETLVKLLELQKQVEDAITDAKAVLEQAALEIDPNFSSIQADKIKVYYRSYGSRYRIDESLIDQVPADLYSKKISYNPIAEAIEKYTTEHKGMPVGVIETERPKSLSFSLKAKQDEQQQ